MTTYDVLVADELLPYFTDDNPLMPIGFQVVGPAEGPASYGTKRFRVRDDSAPEWTEGKLIDLAFTSGKVGRRATIASRVEATA